MSLEDIMEEHCEELKDEHMILDRAEFSDKPTNGGGGVFGSTKPKKTTAMTKKSQTKIKLKSADPIPSEDGSSPGLSSGETHREENIKDWSPQLVLTDWGRTDDVITIGNGERYYFFKIPHKVGSRGIIYHKKEKRIHCVYA